MSKVFRPSNKESKILSKIESSKAIIRRKRIAQIHDNLEPLSNAIAEKLIETKIVETSSKESLQGQIKKGLELLKTKEDFDVDFKIAPFKKIKPEFHIVSLYITAFVIEDIINHQDTVDVYGSDEEIYFCIEKQVTKFIR